jgi:hypothetical protein
MPIRRVVPLHERRVDRRARRRATQQRIQEPERSEDQRPHHLDHAPLLTSHPHRCLAKLGREDLPWLGRPARTRVPRPGLLHAVDLVNRRLNNGACSSMAIDRSSRSPVRLWTWRINGSQVSTFRLPDTRARSKQLSGSTAVWSQSSPHSRPNGCSGSHEASFLLEDLLEDEPPFLIDLNHTHPGGKEARVRRGASRRGRRPAPRSASPCSFHIDQATDGSRRAGFLDRLQDGESFIAGQVGVFEDGPLAPREWTLAGAAGDQANPPALAARVAEAEVLPPRAPTLVHWEF